MFFDLLVQGSNLISSLDGISRIFPGDIVAVCLSYQTGIVALTTIGNQSLIDFIYLVVFLAGSQFVGHLLEDGITLGIQSEGIEIDGLVVKQVVFQILV